MSRADRCLHHSLAHLRCDRPSRRCKITRSSSRTRNRTMQLTYLEAIRQGIWEEMEKDPTVFCIGEDIGIYGGAFKVTDGFIDRFCPAGAYDAKGLIKAAIRDNNPVLFFEHKYLYRRIKEEVPADDYIVPLGKARLAREGRDLSIITYAAMVHTALEAAEILSKEGI